MKSPFDPKNAEYSSKPAFLNEMQRFVTLCEEHGATRFAHEAWSINCGVSMEYQMIVNIHSGLGIRGTIETDRTYGSRAVNFHLVVSYKERTDGVSAACLQYDLKKFPSKFRTLENDIQLLLNEIRGGSPRTDSPTS